MYHIYLETSEQIQISDDDSSHLDIHQENQDDQHQHQHQGSRIKDQHDIQYEWILPV